jgi:hypothetical protein
MKTPIRLSSMVLTMTVVSVWWPRAAALSCRMTLSTAAATNVIPRIKTADATAVTDHAVTVKGWVRTVRKQKTLAFVEVNDGSNLGGIQCVLQFDQMDDHTMNGECVESSQWSVKVSMGLVLLTRR